jgi:hypothetical protein
VPYPEQPRRRGLPIGAWIAIAGAMAFGVALAVMVGTHLLTQPQQPVAANTQQPTPPPEPATEEAQPDPDLVEAPEAGDEAAEPEGEGEGAAATDEGESEEAEEPAEPPARRASGGGRAARRGSGGGSGGGAARSGGGGRSQESGRELDEETRARLARFSDDSASGAQLDIARRSPLGDDDGSGGASLTSEQIARVVRREQRAVQQCWQTALRQVGAAPNHDTRIEVMVTVGGSGTVTSAQARGRGIGNLTTCIERTVRRWRFPRSGSTTRTSIPFVFQGSE